MPRKYSMKSRSRTIDATRRRILDATVQLHNEQGVSATSMQDIADRAGVALATVYRHFPSLNDLVPACGKRNLELNPPPTSAVFDGAASGTDRVRALVRALFSHYERGARPYEVGFAEAVNLPVMAGLMNELALHVRSLVAEAAAPFEPPFEPNEKQLALAAGLCDFRVWHALRQAGLSSPEVAESISRLVVMALASNDLTK